MDINFLRSLETVLMVAAFAGIVWWAYAPSRRERFERDGLLPFQEDGGRLAPAATGETGPLTPSPSPGERGEPDCGAVAPRTKDGDRS